MGNDISYIFSYSITDLDYFFYKAKKKNNKALKIFFGNHQQRIFSLKKKKLHVKNIYSVLSLKQKYTCMAEDVVIFFYGNRINGKQSSAYHTGKIGLAME